MEFSKCFKVEFTGLKFKKPFFQIFARPVDNQHDYRSCYFNGSSFPKSIGVGNVCVAKINDNKFERCRIINTDHFEGRATVHLIDCGVNAKLPMRKVSLITPKTPPKSFQLLDFDDMMSLSNFLQIRILDNNDLALAPSINRGFYMAGIKQHEETEKSEENEFKQEVLQLHNALVNGKAFNLRYYTKELVSAKNSNAEVSIF